MARKVFLITLVGLALTSAMLCFAHQSPAPKLSGGPWLNTPPLKLSELKGKVVIVHFWTFACSNCKANLPAYQRWYERYTKQGAVVIGVHTPELEFERVEANVRDKVDKLGIKYPVLIDGEGKNWNTWKLRCWPTVFVVDKKGRVRGGWEGELNFNNAGGEAKIATLIEKLL